MRRNATRRAAGALALAAAIVLAGCGGDDGAADPVAGSSTPTPAVSAPEQDSGGGSLSGGEATPAEAAEADTPDTAPAEDVDEAPVDEAPVDEVPVDEAPVDEAPTEDMPADDANGLEPGDPCSLEEGSPDCIDPDGDGEGVYLLGGADCVAGAPDPSLCADLDGDGHAGYPDSEGDTAPGEPCSTEEGSPDCIDADGDGEGVLLLGGEECVAMYADESFCADTDGDGYAGERDLEGNLPYPYGG